MKKILYLTNIEVPYRVRFFNELAKYCELTVMYERKTSNNRNETWTKSEKSEYKRVYLNGIHIGDEFAFSFRVFQYIFGGYDEIVLGCFNSPVQIMVSLALRVLNIRYYLCFDGEVFLNDNGMKSKLKKVFMSGAKKYLIAGEKSAQNLKKYVGNKEVVPYHFSSLYGNEIIENAKKPRVTNEKSSIIVIGQYYNYKGMDIAFRVAVKDTENHYKFIGMGKRTEKFVREQHTEKASNVEVVPFLQKYDLEKEFLNAKMLVLPTRQECWGLVINEAASFGTPIVSTWGSGAAVEFLAEDYPKCLAEAGDVDELLECIRYVQNVAKQEEMSDFLRKKSMKYSIENSVQAYLRAIELEDASYE